LAKLELVRGIANPVTYRPSVDGLSVAATSATVRSVRGPAEETYTAPAATVSGDSVSFSFMPPAACGLAEDYSFEIEWAAGGVSYVDLVYFDVVRVPLLCPVTQADLEKLEPDVPKWLKARDIFDAQQWISAAWDDVVSKIRAAGKRPALATDRHVFARPTVHLAISLLCETLVRQPGDLWEGKRDWHAARYEATWAGIGSIRFDDERQIGGPSEKVTISQPRWRR
jgi:hypothetical protein